ncbi:hypothetical protein GLOIN_2v1778298 [Rhizophagus irregularis DAOM 181602=DAOM 197198]|nr:hypothetical protein GLOIN_2v1778298 [Rhizophagus irregularis DAOM 181602=DAOM 197198]
MPDKILQRYFALFKFVVGFYWRRSKSNGGGRVAAAITVVIRSWIIRNIFVVSNFCDKILLIHVFWLVGRGVKQLSQLLWNVSGQMNKDMNVNGHYLITSTFREVLIYIFYEDISQDYIGRSLLWIQKILVNLISFCVWVTY